MVVAEIPTEASPSNPALNPGTATIVVMPAASSIPESATLHDPATPATIPQLVSPEPPTTSSQIGASETPSPDRHRLDTALLKASRITEGVTDEGNLTRSQAFRALGLQEGASKDQIKQAYRAAMRDVHTDTAQSTASSQELELLRKAATAVNVAHDILGKGERKAAPEPSASPPTPESRQSPTDRSSGKDSSSPKQEPTATKQASTRFKQRSVFVDVPPINTYASSPFSSGLADMLAEIEGRVTGAHIGRMVTTIAHSPFTRSSQDFEDRLSIRLDAYQRGNPTLSPLSESRRQDAIMHALQPALDSMRPEQLCKTLAVLTEKNLISPSVAMNYLRERGGSPAETVRLAAQFMNDAEVRDTQSFTSADQKVARERAFEKLIGQAVLTSLDVPPPIINPESGLKGIKKALEEQHRTPPGMTSKLYLVDILAATTRSTEFTQRLATFNREWDTSLADSQ